MISYNAALSVLYQIHCSEVLQYLSATGNVQQLN